jgi:hypothetical protein
MDSQAILTPCKQRGFATMTTLSTDSETAFECALPDLGSVRLPDFRTADHPAVREAILQVVQQTARPGSSVGGSCSQRNGIN